jgi:hypothetical protein
MAFAPRTHASTVRSCFEELRIPNCTAIRPAYNFRYATISLHRV